MSIAVVTGATSGIGRAFAEQLAHRGMRIVLVARNRERLHDLAGRLPGSGHEVIATDLSRDNGCEVVMRRLESDEEPVTLLVNAAGVGTSDSFPRVPLPEEEDQLNLNVRAVMRLCWSASRSMERRQQGAIVNVASTAAIWSAGTYAGSKAWLVATTAGLRAALADGPVGVLSVVPGFTRSEFHERSGVDNSGVRPWLWLTPERVAREALEALDAGRGVCVPARRYRLLLGFMRLLPLSARQRLLRILAPLRPQAR